LTDESIEFETTIGSSVLDGVAVGARAFKHR